MQYLTLQYGLSGNGLTMDLVISLGASVLSLCTVGEILRRLYKVAREAEDVASHRARSRVRSILNFNLRKYGRRFRERTANAITDIFDGFFSSNPWSILFFRRSLGASLVFIITLFLICVGLEPAVFYSALETLPEYGTYVPHGVNLVTVLVVNYFSFVETRRLIALMAVRPYLIMWAVIVVADIALTFLIKGIGGFVKRELWLQVRPYMPPDLQTGSKSRFSIFYWMESDFRIMTLSAQEKPEYLLSAPMIWSTFLTSIVLWILLLSIVLSSVVNMLDKPRYLARWGVSTEKPFIALWAYCSLLLLVGFFAIYVVSLAWRYF